MGILYANSHEETIVWRDKISSGRHVFVLAASFFLLSVHIRNAMPLHRTTTQQLAGLIFKGISPALAALRPPRNIPLREMHPVFVIGAERSGTTLLYSLLANAENATFLTYLDELFPEFPDACGFVKKLAARNNQKISTPFSRGAKIDGRLAPTEGIFYWHTMLKTVRGPWHKLDDDWMDASDVPVDYDRTLARDLSARLNLHENSRIVFKQPGFSLKLGYLHSLFPSAQFVCMVRDPRDIFRSMIHLKKELNHPTWGIKYPGWKNETDSVDLFTAKQIYNTYDLIWKQIEAKPDLNACVSYITYKTLCASPATELQHLFTKLALSGHSLLQGNTDAIRFSTGGKNSEEHLEPNGQAAELLNNLSDRFSAKGLL